MQPNIFAVIASLAIAAGPTLAQNSDMAFGTKDDIAYAEQLWDLMAAARLAGPNMIRAFPYEGTQPHGMMLETFYDVATIGAHTGDLIVKRNFGPEGVSVDAVLADPNRHLGAYTIMFRREDGYDPDNLNWFWARYNPDGSVSRTGQGQAMAGLVYDGCIACHQGAADDLVFTSDHLIAK